jgi:hypothetical protein
VLQQLKKLHFGGEGESLTCARAFSSAVATPCSDSEAGAAPAAKRREHRDQAIQIKVDREGEGPQSGTGRRGTADDHTERSPRRGHGVGASEAEREQEEHRDEAEDAAAPVPALLPLLRHHIANLGQRGGAPPCSSPALSISLLEP